MLCGEIITVCSENHVESVNAPFVQNTEFSSVREGGMYVVVDS
jgi:hypothetical protein